MENVLKEVKALDTKGRKIIPLDDRIVVKCASAPDTNPGGRIVIPDSAKQKPCEGLVLAVGPGKRNDKGERMSMPIEVGQTIAFPMYAGGGDKDVLGEDIKILREADILAVLE